MDVASLRKASSRRGSRFVATTVGHPRLTKTNLSAIRAFLREYEHYAREVQERAQPLLDNTVSSTETSEPIQMNFCVKFDRLGLVADLGFIPNIYS